MSAIIRSNRIGHLADALADTLSNQSGESSHNNFCKALTPDPIVVAHPGMERWLRLQLAQRLGIVMAAQFHLPAGFVGTLLYSGLTQRSPLDNRQNLIWMIYRALQAPTASGRPTSWQRAVRSYLNDGQVGAEVRRYDLAAQLANLYERYSYGRPAWLLHWEEGRRGQCGRSDREGKELEGWQADLWQHLTAAAGDFLKDPADPQAQPQVPPHRAAMLRDFDPGQARLPERLHIFALPVLPALLGEFLPALEGQVDVRLYDLLPGQQYYGDVRRDSDGVERSAGERLFGLLGQVTRDSQQLLLDLEERAPGEYGNRDLFAPPPTGDRLLAQVQRAVGELGLEPSAKEPANKASADKASADKASANKASADKASADQLSADPQPDDLSLQVHSCHSPLREVQVLRDRLLQLFAADKSLDPSEVLVMAPDINLYENPIRAVFGTAEGNLRLPWSLADRPWSNDSPLIRTLLSLLQPEQGEFSLPQVFALLDMDFVHRRLGLDISAVAALRDWSADAGARLGSAGMRSGLDKLYSWDRAIASLLSGFAMNPQVGLPQVRPLGELHWSGAEWVSTLYLFVRQLQRLRELCARAPGIEQWEKICDLLCDLVHTGNSDESQQLGDFKTAFRQTLDRARRAGLESLPLASLHANLRDNLDGIGLERGFLTGAITFCSLVPMRSIPARVICLMGMQAGSFPRRQTSNSLDLMEGQHRPGDRSQRNDDLHVFLQALLSAQDHFILTYEGRNLRDNSEQALAIPASELLSLLPEQARRQVFSEHPMQPFSSRYGQGDLRTYGAEWLPTGSDSAARKISAADSQVEPPARTGTLQQGQLPEPPERLGLGRLQRFLHSPAQAMLTESLHMQLPPLRGALEDSEPYSMNALDLWKLGDWMVRWKLHDELSITTHLRRHELLPAGRGYAKQLRRTFVEATRWGETMRQEIPANPQLQQLQVQLRNCTLTGQLPIAPGEPLIRWRYGRVRPQDSLDLWLEHLLRTATSADSEPLSDSLFLTPKQARGGKPMASFGHRSVFAGAADLTPERARELLDDLLHIYLLGQVKPLPFFAAASHDYRQAQFKQIAQPGRRLQRDAREIAQATWIGNDSEFSNPELEKFTAYRLLFGSVFSPLLSDAFYGGQQANPQLALNPEFEELAARIFDPMLEFWAANPVRGTEFADWRDAP